MFLDLSGVHLISERFERGALRVQPRGPHLSPFELLRGDLRPATPIEFEWAEGKRHLDLVGTTYGVVWLISDRFVATLVSHHLTGWRTLAVNVFDRDGSRVDGYSGLVVTGRSGDIREEQSVKVTRPAPTTRGKPYQARLGLYFDPDTWDGQDLFLPGTAGYVLATAGATHVLQAARLTNVDFRPIATVELTVLSRPEPEARATDAGA